MIGLAVLGLGPILYGFIYYFKDVYAYLTTRETENIQMWQVKEIKQFRIFVTLIFFQYTFFFLPRRIFHTEFYGTDLFLLHLKYMVFPYISLTISWLLGKLEGQTNDHCWL